MRDNEIVQQFQASVQRLLVVCSGLSPEETDELDKQQRETETVAGHVEGVKQWFHDSWAFDTRLYSTVASHAYDPKASIYTAECDVEIICRDPLVENGKFKLKKCRCQTPELLCACGFYAVYEGECRLIWDENYVLGRVAGFGKVIECEYGWRAEKLKILSLWQPAYESWGEVPRHMNYSDYCWRIQRLSSRYDVPVEKHGVW